MVNLYITKNNLVDNGAVAIPQTCGEDDVVLENITKLGIGYNLIYAEYTENGEHRIRAYGRREFKNAIIYDDASQEITFLPLSGSLFHRVELNIPTKSDMAEEVATEVEELTPNEE